MNFSKLNGLIPAVIQDERTNQVLMVGFMNEDALARTRRSGYVTFFSRTGNTLWMKGESSGNKLMVLQLRGTDVRAALEHSVAQHPLRAFVSGATVTFDTTAAPGSRVRDIRLHTVEAFSDAATYTVTVSDFMASGGDGYSMFARALDARATGVIDLDALIEYLQTVPQPVRPPRDVRLRAIPER